MRLLEMSLSTINRQPHSGKNILEYSLVVIALLLPITTPMKLWKLIKTVLHMRSDDEIAIW